MGLVEVLQVGQVQLVPACDPAHFRAYFRAFFRTRNRPDLPRVAAPADGQPALERPFGKPRPVGFVYLLGGQERLETGADRVRVGQVDSLDAHPHSKPGPVRYRY